MSDIGEECVRAGAVALIMGSHRASQRVMLVTSQQPAGPAGGRELLCKLHHDALEDMYGERLVPLELPRRPSQGPKAVVSALRGHMDGLDASAIANGLEVITTQKVGLVVVDGSNLGTFAKAVKQRCPHVEVVCLFHNVEARFFLGAFRATRSLRSLAVLASNYLAERKAVVYSDKIVCLSARDSRLLGRLYGRAATHVSAMALRDQLPEHRDPVGDERSESFVLFVGGMFYANRDGVSWFVRCVVPYINSNVCIVGRGFEGYKHELERGGRVQVVGQVESVADWYARATVAVAPIFDGSGMKTKVAEALMFGKKVIGTPEAFAGYEDVVDRVGWVCTTAEEFVAAIRHVSAEGLKKFDPEMRALYVEKYSEAAARRRLGAIFAL